MHGLSCIRVVAWYLLMKHTMLSVGGRECAGCNIHGPLFKRKCVHYIVLKKKWPLVPSKEEESHCLKGLTHKKDALLLIITPLQLFLVAKTLCHPK
jgi:hypothetical protein